MIPNQLALPASSLRRVLIALVTFTLLAVSLTSAVSAKPGGNSAYSAACENGGYLNWTAATGATFKNEGACVKYAAMGGLLVPVNQFSISYRAGSLPGLFGYTLTGAGLVPSTFYRLWLNYSDTLSKNGGEGFVDSNGDFLVTRENAECVDLGIRPLLSVSVGVNGHTAPAVPLPFPDAFCTPPA